MTQFAHVRGSDYRRELFWDVFLGGEIRLIVVIMVLYLDVEPGVGAQL